MGYVVVVVAQTIILPVVFGCAQLHTHDSWLIADTFGRWFLFWGVGTRLALAGVVQLVKPSFTTQTILGDDSHTGANVVTQELGFANAAIGLGAMVGTFLGGQLAAAITGGLYLGIAGARHLGHRGQNLKERVATWTDLLVFIAMAAYAAALIRDGGPPH
jgi:hypothetical protein